MPRLAICPQQHVWSPAGAQGRPEEFVCPICGQLGSAAREGTDANAPLETLSLAGIPPLADSATVIVKQAAAPHEESSPEESSLEEFPTIPGYDLLRELGRGGMGIVYLARHRELKRPVALKMLLAAGQHDRETRDRFRREAEAVARLQHPGIVQVHDVGEHDGQPYIALEFIDGPNLATRTAGTPLAPRLAAQLIEALARAVDSAHQRGIVHRDLTPRNILLARGASPAALRLSETDVERFDPKITDFGLAKELDDDCSQTLSGVIMGTPHYMSPEQAQGLAHAIGPATDIYALGAIFYELLTGRPPFLAASRLEALKQVVERDPLPPSQLQPRVARDVETICLKCLAKEPQKRFASAAQLADDLHRWQTNVPILARPTSRYERTVKWIKRHPAAAGLLAAVCAFAAILSIVGVSYSVRIRHERDFAERNFDRAMRAVEEMLSLVGERQLAAEPRMEEIRRELLAKALALNQEFLKERSNDPRVRLENAHAHRRMADVLRLLGQNDEAQAAYRQAIKLLERLSLHAPRHTGYRWQLAYCHNFLAEVLRTTGRHFDAELAYRDAIQLLESLHTAFEPGGREAALWRQDQARSLYSLGVLYKQTGRQEEAEAELGRAIAILSELFERDPQQRELGQHLARAFLNLGTVIRAPERQAEADAAYQRAITLFESLVARFSDHPEYRQELAIVLNNAGNLHASAGKLEVAQAMYDKARTLFQGLVVDFPKVPDYRQELANTINSIASLESQQQHPQKALDAWQEAARLLEGLSADRPESFSIEADLGMVRGNLGLVYHAQSRFHDARSQLESAVRHFQSALAKSPGDIFCRECLRDNRQNLAEVLVSAGDHRAAAETAQSLTDVFPGSARDRYFAACFLARCVPLALRDERLAADQRPLLGQRYASASLAMLSSALGLGFSDRARLRQDRDVIFAPLVELPEFQQLVGQFLAQTESEPAK
jgi:eukaryotic-like serine/threonine-protein kinase